MSGEEKSLFPTALYNMLPSGLIKNVVGNPGTPQSYSKSMSIKIGKDTGLISK